ncbi:alpha/beta hydrolase fold domain-containing protein [Cryobacterium arcticum]|uniref:Carboxylesterase n=1 Tax=Cryobacterium arcticum TaxID=670052 RepID=A0A317ZR30_9MICO|nr:alpha/beta hydrolase fold domain-containing protein [Cryobacterium arcticum]PXA68318.1 carboxylesterase [Cryobacterium arcticum]
MTLPLWLADTIATLVQKAPGSPRLAPEVAFAEIPALTEHITIPTRHGDIPAVQYSPPGGAAGRGVYVNLHGGGFVIRHPEQDDALCRFIAATAGVTVLNVDYTPAPQSRFPGPVEQAYDVAAWAAASDRPWDGNKLAIGGQSAGGALAAGAARLALETGSPRIAAQVLMYPPLDLTVSAASKKAAGKETFLVRMGPIFDTAYCPDRARRGDRLISPAGPSDTTSLAGIAPALVITGQKDILRDEAARYSARLQDAGALIAHIDLPEVGHGFNILGAPREVVLPVYQAIAQAITNAFGKG